MSKAKVLKLWRQGPVVARRYKKGGGWYEGHLWAYEQDVTEETMMDWLKQFRKDSPDDTFIVSATEPFN